MRRRRVNAHTERAMQTGHDAEKSTIPKQGGRVALTPCRLGAAKSAPEGRIIVWWLDVWWLDFLWGLWNGFTAWIVLIVHVFGAGDEFLFYNSARSGNWYDFGFLLGAGSPLLGFFRRG
jgi:hypothetical protein